MFYCYGKRSNAFLLLNYGFCIPNNIYDSFTFKVKLNIHLDDIDNLNALLPRPGSPIDNVFSEDIRLKASSLNMVLLGYLRNAYKALYC